MNPYDYTRPYRFKELRDSLIEVSTEQMFPDFSQRFEIYQSFEVAFRDWISSDRHSFFGGAKEFPYLYVQHGINHVIQDFVSRQNRRIRFFSDEYPHIRACCKIMSRRWAEIGEDFDGVSKDESFVVSMPKYQDGSVRKNTEQILETIHAKEISTFLDCSYFGSIPNFELHLNSSVKEIWFSFSKSFALEQLRLSVRLTREPDPLFEIHNKHGYNPLGAMVVTTGLMRRFHPSYFARRYREHQLEICQRNGWHPSDTIWLALTDDRRISLFDEYRRLKL